MDRPEFQRMLADIKDGKVNCVLVKDLSRFSRDYIDAGNYLEKVFPFMGVRFISVTDFFDSFSATGDENTLMVPMKNMLNAAYAKDISRKIITSFKARQKRCEILPAFGPYGYVKSKEVAFRYEVDEKTAPFVKLIFSWMIDGKSMREIIHLLEDLGAPSPAARKLELGIWHNEKYAKTRWNNKTIYDMLRNPIYTGCIVYGRMPKSLAEGIPQHRTDRSEWMIYHDMHEPLVTWEQFDQVQEILAENSRTHSNKVQRMAKQRDKVVDLFRGKIFCGDCGKPMRLLKKYMKSRDSYSRRYACAGYLDSQNKKCSRHSISADEVESAVLAALQEQKEFLCQSEMLKQCKSRSNRFTASKLRRLQAQMDTIATQRNALFESFAEDKISREEYAEEKKSLDKQYAGLELDVKRIHRGEREKVQVIELVGDWLRLLDRDGKKKGLTAELVEDVVERIEVYEDKRIEVSFRFREVSERLGKLLED